MQAYTPSREEELSGLCRSIRRAGEEKGLDPETEALLKMLEKPPYEDEAGRIIRELNEMPPPSPPAENTAREKGRLPDGMMKAEARKQKPIRKDTADTGRKRRPAAAVMLVTFSALLAAGAAFIVSSCRDGGTAEEIPETSASLCKADVEKEGYILGIEGESLAVYYNGALQQSIDFPAAQLTDYDRELLQNGIRLENEAAVRRAIEDYTS